MTTAYEQAKRTHELRSAAVVRAGQDVRKAQALHDEAAADIMSTDDVEGLARVQKLREALEREQLVAKNLQRLADQAAAALEQAELERKRAEFKKALHTMGEWRPEIAPSVERIIALATEIDAAIKVIGSKMAGVQSARAKAVELAPQLGEHIPDVPTPSDLMARALIIKGLFDRGIGRELGRWTSVPLTSDELSTLMVDAFEVGGWRCLDDMSDLERVYKIAAGTYVDEVRASRGRAGKQ
jgi:hypothetical protein